MKTDSLFSAIIAAAMMAGLFSIKSKTQTVETHGRVISSTLEWTGAVQKIEWTGPRKVGRQKITIMVPTEIEVNEAEGGTVTLKSADTNQGAFTIEAQAAEGYVFKGWKGDVGGDWAVMTVVARGQKVVTPIFEKKIK